MKFIITESQLRLLIIEDDDKPGYSWASSQPSTQTSTKAETNLPTVTTYTKTIDSNPIAYCYKNKISADKCITEFCKTNKCRDFSEEMMETTHNMLMVLSIATAFIPVTGPLISAGVQLVDAGLYAAELKGYDAGLTAGLAVIPVAGPILNKIPGVRQLGKKGLQKMFGNLLTTGPKAALPTDQQVLEALAKNKDFVIQQTNQNVKMIANGAANTSKDLTKKEILKNIAIKGKDFTVQGGKELGKDYVTGKALDQTYNIIQSDTPKAIAEKMGLNWEQVKTTFGSENTAEDNIKLKMALQNGWTPGNVVPVQYRTKKYNQQFSQALTSDEESDRARREYLLNRNKKK